MTELLAMKSPVQLATIAGGLYLIGAVFSAFAMIFVDGRIYLPGDASASRDSY